MDSIIPENPYIHKHLFRMTHIDNLRINLKVGLYAPNARRYPEYINIGDETLIEQRGVFTLPVAPGGVLGDYVPFYFGGCSPMLLNIKTGHRGIKQRDQREIVYLCSHIDMIAQACPEYCFTDGHAKDRLTAFYNQLSDLDKIDWRAVDLKYWASTEDEPDNMRRKQAEFLVKTHVPLSCLSGIIVLDDIAAEAVNIIREETGCELPVHIDYKRKYYYND